MRKITKRPVTTLKIRESAEQIWLAGLGAFALANQEGGKLFHNLVKKGHDVQKVSKARYEKVRARVEKIRDNAGRAIEKVTSPFPGGLTTALHGLGVPSRKEILTLTKRVEELTKSVERTRVKARKPVAHKPVPAETV
jgi:poly(hydroxyalkanoate) granule-associated protein